MSDELDPRSRAEKILKIIKRHYEKEDLAASATDILADVRHFCDAHDLSYADRDRVAHDHYTAEVVAAREEGS